MLLHFLAERNYEHEMVRSLKNESCMSIQAVLSVECFDRLNKRCFGIQHVVLVFVTAKVINQ